jgi:hypothetical protein
MLDDTFQHLAFLVGIIAIRFDSRWRYQNTFDFTRVFATPTSPV